MCASYSLSKVFFLSKITVRDGPDWTSAKKRLCLKKDNVNIAGGDVALTKIRPA
jgi:hypothetical protein